MHEASRFLTGRAGSGSFAAVDERGRVHGHRWSVQYSSASIVKAMLLVAYLDRKDVRHRALRRSERGLLGQMIRVWGGCQVTARDQARFFSRIRSLLSRRHRAYGLGLLHRIASYERWGIPQGAPRGWRLYFKGGWFRDDDGWRVHQAALLRKGKRRISIAVLTRGSPSLGYGAATIAGVTSRLLRRYR